MALTLTHCLISARCLFMASMLTVGMTRAAPVPRAGQMAPNRKAQVNRRSRLIRGRVPRLAQMRVSVPCWPTRASSETRFRPAGRQLPWIAVRASSAKFFKSLLGLKVALRMHGTPRHAAEIQLLQQLADAALMQVNMEFGGDAVPQVSTAPAHHAIGLEVRGGFWSFNWATRSRCEQRARRV